MASPPVPKGLTPASAEVWQVLTSRHRFQDRELYVFARALKWWDLSDGWLAESMAATGPDQARLVKQSLDGAAAALRLWRSLKFTDVPARVGRPAGDDWSPKRKLQRAAGWAG